MRCLWAFLTLRDVIHMILPGSPAVVASRLAEHVESRRSSRWRYARGYEGAVSPEGFTMTCIGRSRHDPRPAVVVHGIFREIAGDTAARVVVRHGLLTLVAAWSLLALGASFGMMALCLLTTNAELAALLSAAWWVFLLVPGLWMCLNFGAWSAVRSVRHDVREILDATSADRIRTIRDPER